MKQIKYFIDEYAFLSNFYPSIFKDDEGILWNTAEHFFQAMKTLDKEEREVVRLSTTAGRAKRAGRKVTLRKYWEDIKINVMRDAIKYKFHQNESLMILLSLTGSAYITETNRWHDNIWGNCACEKCKDIKGKNLLGVLLMELRDMKGN